MAAASVDSMIKEYLIFRGFSSSLKCFEADLRSSKDKSFKVENIIEQIQIFINSYDVLSLRNYWRYFDKRYFYRLGQEGHKSIKRLESSVLRLYVVHAIQNNKMERVTEFFEKYASDLQHDDSWKDWFVIPFMKNAEQNKVFAMYFTKFWQESVMLSLYNCLDTIFTHMPFPMLLNFENEKRKSDQLLEETAYLKEQLSIY